MLSANRRRKASTIDRDDAKKIRSSAEDKPAKRIRLGTNKREAAKKKRLKLLTEIKITTVEGKIEQQKVDAIVCAVDNSLNMAASGTVAKTVLSVGGKTLMTEYKTMFPSGINYGEVVAISGGNLKCKKIYLMALPDFATEDEADKRADTSMSCKILYEVVLKTMDRVIKDGMTSVAFPAIGTSKLNLSFEKVAKTFFDAVEAKILQSGRLIDVRFVLHDHDTFQRFENIGIERPLLSVQDAQLITERLVEAHINTYPEHFMSTVRLPGFKRHPLFKAMLTKPSGVYVEYYQQNDKCLNVLGVIGGRGTSNANDAIERSVQIYNCIPGYTKLTLEDQNSLFRSSVIELIVLLNYGNTLLRTDLMDGVIITVDDAYVTEQYEFAKTLRNLHLSMEELVLMYCIAATFRDRCTLQDPKSVERIQLMLIQCLRWVVKGNNMDTGRRLSQILDRLTAVRNITERAPQF